jgi:hypothetical protein
MSNRIYCNDLKREINSKECYFSINLPNCKNCSAISSKPGKLVAKTKTLFKMTLNDTYQALSRNSVYKNEWEKLQKISDNKEYNALAEELKKKYKIPRLPTPIDHSRKRGSYTYDPVEVLARPPSDEFPEALPDTLVGAMESISAKRKLRIENFVMDDRYIDLRVDLTFPMPQLKKAFEEKIKKWRVSISRLNRGGRVRETNLLRDGSVTQWTVHDLNQLDGKSLLQITRDLFKLRIPRIPANDNRFFKLYMKVCRAFQKAEDMIKQAIPQQ